MAYVFNKEMSVSLGGTEEKILINAGFFSFHTKTSPLHQHHYTEVHLFESGYGIYTTPSQRFVVGAGDMLCFPAGCFHSCSYLEEGARHIDFQTTHTVKEATVKKLAPGIVPALFAEITRVGENRSSARLRAYLSLLCAEMAARYPNAKVLLGHSGLNDKGREMCHTIAQNPAYNNVYFENCGTFCSEIRLEESLKFIDYRRFLYGTDAPIHSIVWELGRLLSADIPDDQMKAILGGNTKKLFGF